MTSGQDQRGFDRVERFRRIELLIVWIGPRAHHVGDIFFRATFGKESLAKLIAPAGHGSDFDFRKFLFEIRQHRLVPTDVNRDLPFFLGRFESPVPFLLPSGLRCDRSEAASMTKDESDYIRTERTERHRLCNMKTDVIFSNACSLLKNPNPRLLKKISEARLREVDERRRTLPVR